ncbi:putative N-succinyl-L,L-diaminopimelate desuccinylase [Streptomyces misionensis JCM 4497]
MCSRLPSGKLFAYAGGTNHDRKLHASDDRHAIPAGSGRGDRGRGRPAAHRLRRPDQGQGQRLRGRRHDRRPAREQAPAEHPQQGPHPRRLGHRVRPGGVQGRRRQGRRPGPGHRGRARQAARGAPGVPERHLRRPAHRSALGSLRHSHVGDDRQQEPPGGRGPGHRQEGRPGRRLRRLPDRRRLDLHPQGRHPGHQRMAGSVRQEARRGARHRLGGPGQAGGQEVSGRQEAHHRGLRRRPAVPDPAALGRRRRGLLRLPGGRVRGEDLGWRQGLPGRR